MKNKSLTTLVFLIASEIPCWPKSCTPPERKFTAADARFVDGDRVVSSDGLSLHIAIKDPQGGKNQASVGGKIETASHGVPALSITADACTSIDCKTSSMQKWHVELLQSSNRNNIGIAEGEAKFVDMKFAVSQFDGDAPVVMVQLWQGAPHAPPFAGVLKRKDGNIFLSFQVQNNKTGSNPGAKPIEIGQAGPILIAHNYTLSMRFKPFSDQGQSAVLSVSDERGLANSNQVVTTKEYIGYDTRSRVCIYDNKCDVALPNKKLEFSFGVYRHSESKKDVISFQSVAFGSTDLDLAENGKCN